MFLTRSLHELLQLEGESSNTEEYQSFSHHHSSAGKNWFLLCQSFPDHFNTAHRKGFHDALLVERFTMRECLYFTKECLYCTKECLYCTKECQYFTKECVHSTKECLYSAKECLYCTKNVFTPPKNVCTAPKNVCASPKNVCTPPKNVCTAPKNVCTPPKNVCTPPELGSYWQIHLFCPWDFLRPSRFRVLENLLGVVDIFPSTWWSTDKINQSSLFQD